MFVVSVTGDQAHPVMSFDRQLVFMVSGFKEIIFSVLASLFAKTREPLLNERRHGEVHVFWAALTLRTSPQITLQDEIDKLACQNIHKMYCFHVI